MISLSLKFEIEFMKMTIFLVAFHRALSLFWSLLLVSILAHETFVFELLFRLSWRWLILVDFLACVGTFFVKNV